MGSWYETGYGAIAKEEERKSAGQLPNSFWVAVNATKPIVFVDDSPFNIQEHTVKLLTEKFYKSLTCIKGAYPEDPQCCIELGHRHAGLVGYLTIVDCSPKKDPKYENELQLFQGKMPTLKKLQLKKGKGNKSLLGVEWSVTRTGEKCPRCGDDFDQNTDITLNMTDLYNKVTFRGKKIAEIFNTANKAGPEAIAKVQKVFQVSLDASGKILPVIPAFNYMELLKPLDPQSMRITLKSRVKEEKVGTVGAPGSQEEVPF